MTFAFYTTNKRYKSDIICANYSYIKFMSENGFEDNIELYCSNDGKNWIKGNITIEDISSLIIDTVSAFVIGRTVSGSIIISDSYIKLDRKLVFNGQQS